MAQKQNGEKTSSASTTNSKGVTTTVLTDVIVQDGKLVQDDTKQGVRQ